MDINVNVITLAVQDLDSSKRFYTEGLGASITQDQGGFVSLDLAEGSSGLALYRREDLAGDAGVRADGSGFRGVTLSYITDSADQVDAVIARAAAAGGAVTKPAKRALWGGYSGVVADPDGHLWKVATSKAPPRFRRRPADVTPAPPQETIVTVGVADIKVTKAFYEALGLPVDKSYAKFVSFNPKGSSGLGLYRRNDLADDAGVAPEGTGFRGFTFSHIVDSPDEVDAVIARAVAAGGTASKPAEKAAWGGYSGYVTDPDGVLWKVASPT
jgi:catechol 2,3-dioxygenase-like lactoylglutathione lyase family enzyme